MPFEIIRNDITRMAVDAIVNTANPRPVVGAGTDRAIHRAAGPRLLEARKAIGELKPGESAVTPGFDLEASWVIHTVSPAWTDGRHGEERLLRKAYDSALMAALHHKCRSVAFPLMAAGSYGFPKDRALQIALEAFSAFLMHHSMNIWLVVFNKEAFCLSQQLVSQVESYIDDDYVVLQDVTDSWGPRERERLSQTYQNRTARRRPARQAPAPKGPPPGLLNAMEDGPEEACRRLLREQAPIEQGYPEVLACETAEAAGEPLRENMVPFSEEALKRSLKQEETFTQALLRIIGEQGWTESEVYHRVHMDRKAFNKIRNNPNAHPKKSTALQLAVALHLNYGQTQEFIGRAGFTLTRASLFDQVLGFFLEHEVFDINQIDSALFLYTSTTLSKCS